MGPNAKDLGRQLFERRKALGFKTQQSLSEATGVLRKRISEMENGRYTGRITDLNRVLAALDFEMNFTVTSRPMLSDLHALFPEEAD